MQTTEQILKAAVQHTEIAGQHSILIHDLVSGKHIRYPVTTKSDAEYVAGFLRTVLQNTHLQLSECDHAAMLAADESVKTTEPTEVPPSVTGPVVLETPSTDDESEESEESDDDLTEEDESKLA